MSSSRCCSAQSSEPRFCSALTLGTFAAGVFGLVLIARGGAAARKTAIPFGPFLGFGAIVVLLFG